MDKEIEAIIQESGLTADEASLYKLLQGLHFKLRDRTKKKFERINPFFEDVFSWKERGEYWTNSNQNVTIYHSTTLNGDVEIGEHTWIGPFCSLDGGGGLKIGSYCSIAASCHILTHDTVKWALSMGLAESEFEPTKIGDGCFIGTGVVILKGVELGNQCLVAAGSVVTKSFPALSIIGGIPAKKIGRVILTEKNEVFLAYDNHNE